VAVEVYQNLSGDSGVARYSVSPDSIAIEFMNGSTYVYDYATTGEEAVEEMKMLARHGEGLNTFINRHVKKRYAWRATS